MVFLLHDEVGNVLASLARSRELDLVILWVPSNTKWCVI